MQVRFGGLGDSLFQSHIPRLAKASGKYDRVLISDLSPFRDPSYRRLVWELNPYVDGFTPDPGLTLDDALILKGLKLDLSVFPPGANFLDLISAAYDVSTGNLGQEPEIYYVPRTIDLYKGLTIFDPNWVSNIGAIDTAKIEKYFKDHGVTVDRQFSPRAKALTLSGPIGFIPTYSIEEFCDIIHSAGRIYTLVTGTPTLASAIRKPCTVFFDSQVGPLFLHSGLNKYVRLEDKS